MLLLQQNITKQGQVDKATSKLEFDNGNSNSNKNIGKYKVEAIKNSMIYVKKSEKSQLPGFYYLIL